MSDPTDAMHKLARSQTDPLFIQDHFLATGHDVNTKNTTATYVQFEDRVYAVTCRHVLEVLENRIETQHSRFPTLALVINRAVLNLSFFTVEGLKHSMVAPKTALGENPLDLAIADITGSYWELLKSRKGKAAIDLNNWREPRWARADTLVAAGYPDEHKQHLTIGGEENLAAPMTLVCAQINGEIAKDQREVRMRSRLEKPHGYYFSGMSGGPIYVQQDELLVPVGILYEGWPATSNNPVVFDETGTKVLFDGRDIIVHGLTLTPDNFVKWLKAAKSENTLNPRGIARQLIDEHGVCMLGCGEPRELMDKSFSARLSARRTPRKLRHTRDQSAVFISKRCRHRVTHDLK